MSQYDSIIHQIKSALMANGGELEIECIRWIQDVCRNNNAANVEVIDTGYDASSFGRILDEPIDTTQFETIQDFLDYPTGRSVPTFESGSGMRYETWDDIFIENVRECLWKWLEERHLKCQVVDKDDCIDDEFIDELVLSSADEYYFCSYIGEKQFPNLKLVKG